MVTDTLANAAKYYGMGERISVALKYLQETDFSKVDVGRYELRGNDVYALVQQYDSRPLEKGKWEAHRQYIDVQYVVSGIEQMGYANLDAMKITKDYDEKDDYVLAEGKGNFILYRAGTFAIFMPQDAHMPCMAVESSVPVKKVVVKVRV